jgi:hypothetical protein
LYFIVSIPDSLNEHIDHVIFEENYDSSLVVKPSDEELDVQLKDLEIDTAKENPFLGEFTELLSQLDVLKAKSISDNRNYILEDDDYFAYIDLYIKALEMSKQHCFKLSAHYNYRIAFDNDREVGFTTQENDIFLKDSHLAQLFQDDIKVANDRQYENERQQNGYKPKNVVNVDNQCKESASEKIDKYAEKLTSTGGVHRHRFGGGGGGTGFNFTQLPPQIAPVYDPSINWVEFLG